SDSHFHGPAAAGVGPAGVQVPMTVLPDVFPLGVTSGAFSGTAILTAAQETMFLDELLYINIHSVGTFAAGEIRGQVLLPEPATLGLLALGFAGLAWTGRRRA
ncbi:MAG: CHRD domain-containing protein, partial [Myxococcota bacterium]